MRLRLQQTWHAVAAAGHAEQAEAARRALAEQHHLMGQLLRTTRQGYWRIDTAGVGMDVNPAMCLLLGRPREEMVGAVCSTSSRARTGAFWNVKWLRAMQVSAPAMKSA